MEKEKSELEEKYKELAEYSKYISVLPPMPTPREDFNESLEQPSHLKIVDSITTYGVLGIKE